MKYISFMDILNLFFQIINRIWKVYKSIFKKNNNIVRIKLFSKLKLDPKFFESLLFIIHSYSYYTLYVIICHYYIVISIVISYIGEKKK